MPDPVAIRLVDPDGVIRDVSTEAAASMLSDPRWRVASTEDELGRVSAEAKAEEYGGVGGAIKAGVAGVARGATLGLSDVAARAIGGEDAGIALEGLRSENPGVSFGSELAGALAPAFISGGASLPAGAAVSAGRGLAAAAGGGLRGAIAGGAVEGAIFGGGQAVSELALSDDPLTVERVASSLSSNMLYGAGLGAAGGGLFKAAETGLARAKGAIDTALERRALKAKTPAQAIESGDLSMLDTRMLDAAQKGELARIHAEQAPQRTALTEELSTWRKANRDTHDIRATAQASSDPNLREASGAFDRANLRLRSALDDRVGFAEDPLKAVKLVRAQAQALAEMQTAAQAQARLWREAVDTAPQRFRADIEAISSKPTLAERTAEGRARGMPDYTGPFTPAGLDHATERAIKEYSGLRWDGAVRHGLGEPDFVRYLPKFEAMIAANQRLGSQLEALAKPPTSDLLTKIADARAVLEVPKAPSLGGAALAAAAPFAGPLGVAAAAGGRVLGGFRKLAAAAAERTGKAASAFLGTTGKATAKAAPFAPVLATKTLAAVSYASEPRERNKPAPTKLADLYKARTAEVKAQVHIAPDGSFQMRPEARAKMAARFDGIRAADPRLADKLETEGARRIAYLASIMPRLPDYGVMQIGPERRTVPELKMRGWARVAAALEDPDGVFERAVHGRVSPMEAQALRAVFPGKLDDFIRQVSEQLPTLRANLPRARRLALSILTGIPVDPAMTPGVLRVIQGMYASEPGTGGGTQAPTPQPQFGSISRSEPGTPSQQRQERAS